MLPLTIRRPFKFYLAAALMLLCPGIPGIQILRAASEAIGMARPADPKLIILLAGLSIFMFISISSTMNYFGLTEDHFVVRNHHFFWKQSVYRVNDIREVVFETHSRSANILRIITKDLHTKQYAAGTLRNKHWLALRGRLQEKGVTVKDECIKPK